MPLQPKASATSNEQIENRCCRLSGLLGMLSLPEWLVTRGLMQWERRFLASQLKVEYSAEERDELFLKWNIYKDSKERKLQLVRQLWAANRQ